MFESAVPFHRAEPRRSFLTRITCGVAAFCLTVGCSEKKVAVLSREQMWEWIGHHVQVGMPIETASAAIEKGGFVCSSHSKTSTKIVDANKTATTGVFDFVKCEREDGSPPIKRIWEVTLVREGSLVKAIGLRFRDDYPRSAPVGEKSGS
jgi:hypothetical protein